MDSRKVNLNDRVRFKLTPLGESILMGRKDTAIFCDYGRRRSDGVMDTQLWNFMEMFGPHLWLGQQAITEGNELEVLG